MNMSTSEATNDLPHLCSIAVIAKCPIPGKTKTRLISLLGEDGSAELAKSMLIDILNTLSSCESLISVDKIIFYAPPTLESETLMKDLIILHGIPISSFTLLPMMSDDMNSSDLSSILESSLCTVRRRQQEVCTMHNCWKEGGYVIFLGMDAPELHLHELIGIVNYRNKHQVALILPADDGGYGLLAVPSTADPKKTFHGIRWSHHLTSLSQIKAFTDQDIPVIIGQLMFDIDEPDDVIKLCDRIREVDKYVIPTTDTLSTPSILVNERQNLMNRTNSLRYTKKSLRRLGLLN